MNIITGEKFLSIADYIFINNDKIKFHKNIFNFCTKDKFIYFNDQFKISNNDIDKLNNSNNILRLFVYGDHLLNFFNNIFEKINKAFILIVHNSDENISDKYVKYFNNNKILKIFAQNIDIDHQKLHYLPIGIGNSQWEHGNLNIIQSIMNLNLSKNNLIYYNFSVNNAYKTRPQLYDILNKNGFIFTPNKPLPQYLYALAQCKFTFSPNGNGIDCHRTWEALYLGVIPIMESSIFAIKLAKEFPILVVEDWNIITPEFLNKKYIEINQIYDKTKLDFSYFKSLITSII